MKIIKNLSLIFASSFLLAGIFLSQKSYAEVAVIVNANNMIEISAQDLQRIYLGKLKSFPVSGEAVIPVDQTTGNPAREAFSDNVIKKSESQLKSYWSRLVFTGKGIPPQEVGNSADVMKIVGSNPNTIGYVDASVIDESVRVIHKIK